jgi:hypothetical protein
MLWVRLVKEGYLDTPSECSELHGSGNDWRFQCIFVLLVALQNAAFVDPLTEQLYSGPTTKLASRYGEWITVAGTIALSQPTT